jgi:hypothetical protein
MKLATLTKFSPVLVLAMALLGNVARANPIIQGQINFDGVATTNNGTLATATSFATITSTYVVPGNTGTYSSVPLFTPVTFTPFTFSPFPPGGVTPLWTFTVGSVSYWFDATSLTVDSQSAGFLNLSGSGWAYITGYTPTLGVWSITDTTPAGKPSKHPTFTFGADSATLPDSGGTALLIGLGLAGIAAGMVAQRRRLAKV